MAPQLRRVLVGDDPALTRRILALAAVLSGAAVATVAVPAVWDWLGWAETATVRLAAAAGFLAVVLGGSYLLASAGGLDPRLPIAAVGVVVGGFWLTGVVTDAALLFILAPLLLLGIVATLAAYANDGALVAMSLVFWPVFAYISYAPTVLPAGLPLWTRLRVALLFSLLFTLSIGAAGFLIGSWSRWLVRYAAPLSAAMNEADETEVETVGEIVEQAVVELKEATEKSDQTDDRNRN